MQLKRVKVADLRIRNVIRLFEGAYGIATVYRINEDKSVQVWRPYITTANFEYTGGVIPYIGLEDLAINGVEVELIQDE